MRKAVHINLYAGLLLLSCLTLRAQSVRVGFTRIDSIVSLLPESRQIESQLTTQQKQAENEVKRLQKEFNEKYAIYQKTSTQLTEMIRKDRETELQNLQTRIQEFGRSAQESLQKKYKQLISPILSKVQQAIDTVAKQNGYQIILNVGSGGAYDILYASEENNITNLVIKRLGIVPLQAPEKAIKTLSAPKNTASPKKR